MKKLHKLLYSLFGFFACNFGAHAGTVSGEITSLSDYALRPFSGSGLSTTQSFFCCKVAAGVQCKTSETTGQCTEDGCHSLSNYGAYDAVTVSYTAVWGLNLYGCQIVSQGCYSNTRGFDGNRCVNCPTGSLSSCSSFAEPHKDTCGSACSKGFYSSGTGCERCQVYTTASGGTSYGTTSSCMSSEDATKENCYLPNGTSAKDATGYFSITGGNCFYKS